MASEWYSWFTLELGKKRRAAIHKASFLQGFFRPAKAWDVYLENESAVSNAELLQELQKRRMKIIILFASLN